MVTADADAVYEKTYDIDLSGFVPMIAKPGHPEDDTAVDNVRNLKIDSGFIGAARTAALKTSGLHHQS